MEYFDFYFFISTSFCVTSGFVKSKELLAVVYIAVGRREHNTRVRTVADIIYGCC